MWLPSHDCATDVLVPVSAVHIMIAVVALFNTTYYTVLLTMLYYTIPVSILPLLPIAVEMYSLVQQFIQYL